jgi:hypothetical protein
MPFSFPALRKKKPSEPITGGNTWFQTQSPQGSPVSADQLVGGTFQPGIYYFHEGDLFTPGTGNFVFVNGFELPLVTMWGKGFLRTPNTFNPLQPRPLVAPQTVTASGLGGLQAGQFQLDPLQAEPGVPIY